MEFIVTRALRLDKAHTTKIPVIIVNTNTITIKMNEGKTVVIVTQCIE